MYCCNTELRHQAEAFSVWRDGVTAVSSASVSNSWLLAIQGSEDRVSPWNYDQL